MGFFDDYFDAQQFEPGRGLPGWLESLQQQPGYQPGQGFGGWPEPAGGNLGQQTGFPQVAPATPASQPSPYSAGSVPLPKPRPDDIPTQSIPIGSYLMPQFGGAPAVQPSQSIPDFGDRLSAGFRSWAYTPVGNPFAALANAITGFNSGQLTSIPSPRVPDPLLRELMQQREDGTTTPVSGIQTSGPTPPRPIARTLTRRAPLMRR